MATAKMQSAADTYRKIKEKREKGQKLYDVECRDIPATANTEPIEGCGMVWKCRREKMDFWVSSGQLPAHLAGVMVKASQKGGTASAALLSQDAESISQGIVFSSKVVLRTAVEPRIVQDDANVEGPNDITQKEVMTCCYQNLLNWQMQGGAEGKALETFPQ